MVEVHKKRFFYISPEDYEKGEEIGLSKTVIYQRVHQSGWDVERAITTPKKETRKYMQYWEKFKDIASVDRQTFSSRMNYGWSPVRAALLPKMEKGTRNLNKSKYTKEQIDKMKEMGITHRTMRYRIKNMGLTIEKALSFKPLSRRERGLIRVGKKVI